MKSFSSGMVFLFLSLPCLVFSQDKVQDPLPSRKIIEEIRNPSEGTAVWWTGQAGWLIKSGDILIGVDLVLEDPERIYQSPVTALELAAELDIAFVTHEHGDHFNNAAARVLAERSKCMFIVPRSCLEKARKLGIPENRIRIAVPGEDFEIMGVHINPLHALHGHRQFSIHKGANFDDCGYLITMGGKSFMHPGDTFLLQEHLELQQRVDVLFFSPTEHNMHIQQSVILINELQPGYILPQHGGTYRQTPQNRYWTHNYPEEVKTFLSPTLRERYHILEHGERLKID